MSFVLEFKDLKLAPGTKLNNVIKVPVRFATEYVKYYPEFEQYLFMPFDEIKNAIKELQKSGGKLPITENHVEIFDEDGKTFTKIPDNAILGYISEIKINEEHRAAEGQAYFRVSKIRDFLADALIRGHQIGVSVGGHAGEIGSSGFFGDQRFDGIQQKLRFHHAALVTEGLPRCPLPFCGFNLKDAFDMKACVKTKIPIFKTENKDWTMEHILGAAYGYCRHKLKKGTKDAEDLDITAELPPKIFLDFHKLLVDDGTISSEVCSLKTWNEFKTAWKGLIADGLLNEEKNDIHIKNFNKNKVIPITEEELKNKLNDLEVENKRLKDAAIKDAEKLITDLQTANKAFQEHTTALTKKVNDLDAELGNYRKAEIEQVKKILLDSKRYTPEEVEKYTPEQLRSEYSVAIRFITDATKPPAPVASGPFPTIYRPPVLPTFSTLPRVAPETKEPDKKSEKKLYRIGSPPPAEALQDQKLFDQWKKESGVDS